MALSKTGRFLSKAEILGVGGSFPPLSTESGTGTAGTAYQEPKPGTGTGLLCSKYWNTETPSFSGCRKRRSAKGVRSLFFFVFGTLSVLVAHDCGYPLSRYTCRATRVAADFLDFIAFCRCSTGVALHPLKILVSRLPPPLCREVSHRNLGLKRCRATRGCRS